MLTEVQAEAVERAGIEVATLRLAAMSTLKPEAPIEEYSCKPPPEKRDVETWLESRLRRRLAEELFIAMIAIVSVVALVGGTWELVRFAL